MDKSFEITKFELLETNPVLGGGKEHKGSIVINELTDADFRVVFPENDEGEALFELNLHTNKYIRSKRLEVIRPDIEKHIKAKIVSVTGQTHFIAQETEVEPNVEDLALEVTTITRLSLSKYLVTTKVNGFQILVNVEFKYDRWCIFNDEIESPNSKFPKDIRANFQKVIEFIVEESDLRLRLLLPPL